MVAKGRAKKKIVKAEILREVGYSDAIVRQPHKVFESDGFLELCDEIGLTEDFLLKALKEDIRDKPQNRKGEIELGMKVRGLLKDNPQQPQGTTNNIFIFENEQQSKVARRIVGGASAHDSSR